MRGSSADAAAAPCFARHSTEAHARGTARSFLHGTDCLAPGCGSPSRASPILAPGSRPPGLVAPRATEPQSPRRWALCPVRPTGKAGDGEAPSHVAPPRTRRSNRCPRASPSPSRSCRLGGPTGSCAALAEGRHRRPDTVQRPRSLPLGPRCATGRSPGCRRARASVAPDIEAAGDRATAIRPPPSTARVSGSPLRGRVARLGVGGPHERPGSWVRATRRRGQPDPRSVREPHSFARARSTHGEEGRGRSCPSPCPHGWASLVHGGNGVRAGDPSRPGGATRPGRPSPCPHARPLPVHGGNGVRAGDPSRPGGAIRPGRPSPPHRPGCASARSHGQPAHCLTQGAVRARSSCQEDRSLATAGSDSHPAGATSAGRRSAPGGVGRAPDRRAAAGGRRRRGQPPVHHLSAAPARHGPAVAGGAGS
jgi:hypothetical protein